MYMYVYTHTNTHTHTYTHTHTRTHTHTDTHTQTHTHTHTSVKRTFYARLHQERGKRGLLGVKEAYFRCGVVVRTDVI